MNSYWIDSTKNKAANNRIDDNYKADVCVIGAGITGLSTAYYLAKSGLKVIVVDKSEIGQKTSGHTTAKITLQHGLIYDYLIKSFGFDFAKKYFESNKNAISNIKNIIDCENIDCDFEYQDNYIYVADENNAHSNKSDIKTNLTKIYNEIKAINSLSDDNFAEFTTNCDLPFKIAGAIKTKNQAQFHPIKYMLGLAKAINNYGGIIFTNSLARDIQQNTDEYITYVEEYTIKSKYVVIASHYPFINFPGFYFSKMYQTTSYAIGIETSKPIPKGMYINTGEPVFSFRTVLYNTLDNNIEENFGKNFENGSGNNLENNFGNYKRLLIISGCNHKTGYAPESEDFFGYNLLEKEAKKLYPDCKILYKWNTRDCITLDKVPYIGQFSIFMPNMYVATGFNKWGMTSSNVAANIIGAEILKAENKLVLENRGNDTENGLEASLENDFENSFENEVEDGYENAFEEDFENEVESVFEISSEISSESSFDNTDNSKIETNLLNYLKYADIYDSRRFAPIKNRGEMKNMINQVFHSFVTNRIKIPDEDLTAIKNDNGGIIKIKGTAVGIYKNKDGEIFAVDPTCTHLGCLLTWNNLDKTWDCPCHGSRFDYRGKNLYDPAFKDLDTYGIN